MPPNSAVPRITTQAAHARSDVLVRLAHAGIPWALFLLLTVAGNVLRLVFGKIVDHGGWIGMAAGLVLLAGIGLTVLDRHLRRHRMTWVGRTIGPVTIAAASAMTAAFLLAGYSVPLVLAWLFGGVAACTGWDLWMHSGASLDITRALPQAALASGLGDVRVMPGQRRPAARGSRPGRITGTMALQGGEVSPAEVAERVTHLEGAVGYPPGAMSVTPNGSHAGFADYTVSDPQVLAQPVPWPGPSAPGAPVSVPFRMGIRQDAEWFMLQLLPIFHVLASGGTGSGKTMSWLWNRLAEGVTRQGYAAFAMDLNKGWQFLGPVRGGLHAAAVTPEAVLDLLTGLDRARRARLDYLAKRGMTEWRPGCGLVLMDCAIEEAPDTFTMLEKIGRGRSGAPYDIETWKSNAKGGRSAGMRWEVSLQLAHNTEIPVAARGQFQRVCFGTSDPNESKLGLSTAQREAGCRPELWGSRYPGKAYADLPTAPSADIGIPLRCFDWGGSGEAISAYMADWAAAGRPLDEVTGEALEARPALPPSYGLPGPGGRLAGAVPGGRWPENVTALPGVAPPAASGQREAFEAADRVQRLFNEQLAAWLAAGKGSFVLRDLTMAGLAEKAGRSRPWLYNAIETGCQTGHCRLVADKPAKRWEILPQGDARSEQA